MMIASSKRRASAENARDGSPARDTPTIIEVVRNRLIAIALASILCAAMPSCSTPATPTTALVVVVRSDLAVPAELASVRVAVGGLACMGAACAHDFALTGASAVALPFSFLVRPSGEGGAVTLVVWGRDGSGADRVVRSVTTAFAVGRTVLLTIWLERACDGVSCSGDATCIGGACASAAIDPSTLPDVRPGEELFADAGVHPDAALDAGSLPRSCAALAAGTPSGAYTIDPDGPGGAMPFLDYCDNDASGGGWTLIAAANPVSPRMAYADTAWTSDAPPPGFGTADLSVQDALFDSYWTLPVHELRIVMADPATPTDTRALETTLAPSTPTTLRAAMESGTPTMLDAPSDAWRALVSPTAASLTATTCEAGGVPAQIPSTGSGVRVRIGYVWSDQSGCSTAAFWAGIGADGLGCRPVASASGGGRICGTGAERDDYPLAVWVFGR
jgi:hypothetical protein